MPLIEPKKTSSSVKTNYIMIKPGKQTIVQILDTKAAEVARHWVTDGSGKSFSVKCLSAKCPFCVRNASIGYNRDDPNFVPVQRRYAVNVLDLTPVRKCPGCDAENESTFTECFSCGTDISKLDPEPSGRVKILERGRRLFEQIAALENTPNPMAGGKIIPIQKYPIMLIANGEKTEMTILVLPLPPNDINPEKYEKLDLQSMVSMTLSPEELHAIMDGGTLQDILAKRFAENEISSSVETASGRIADDIDF